MAHTPCPRGPRPAARPRAARGHWFALVLALCVLAPPRLAEADREDQPYYALSGRYGLFSGPVKIQRTLADPTSTFDHWHHTPAMGIRIQENWKGPIYWINQLWFAVASMGQGYDPSTGTYVVTAHNVDGSGGAWLLDVGDNYGRIGFEARLMQDGASYLDLAAGFWLMPATEVEKPLGQLAPDSVTAQILRDAGGEQVVRVGGAELFMLRIRYAYKQWGSGSTSGALFVGEDFTLLNALLFWYMPFGSQDFSDFVWRWGIPRTSLSVEQRLGPLFVRGSVSVPNTLLVVPWHVRGLEGMVEAGLRI